MTFPFSTPSVPLPPCTLFCFLFVASMEEACVGVGVGCRVNTGMAREEPPVWEASKVSRSGVFSSNLMPFGMFVASWLALTCAGFRRLCEVERLQDLLVGRRLRSPCQCFLVGRLECGLLGFVVRWDEWFLGVEEPSS